MLYYNSKCLKPWLWQSTKPCQIFSITLSHCYSQLRGRGHTTCRVILLVFVGYSKKRIKGEEGSLSVYMWNDEEKNNFPLFLSLKTNRRGSTGRTAELFSWKNTLRNINLTNPSTFMLPNHRLISSAALLQKQHSP